MNMSKKRARTPAGVRQRRRQAIILLVVLGMLALFSLLAATYIIFSARSRQASFAIGRREARDNDPKPLLDEAIGQVIRGSGSNASSMFMHSMLDDYYGNDRLIGKVLNGNAQDPNGLPWDSSNTPYAYIPNTSFGPEAMLGSKPLGTGRAPREAELLKIPVQIGTLAANPTQAFPSQFSIEDSLVGRYLVFDQGPLSGLMLEIVRSFGHIEAGDPAEGNRNCVIVSLAAHLTSPIAIGGNTELLTDWLPRNPVVAPALTGTSRALIYDITNPALLGYQFHITPRVKDGKGFGWALNTGGQYNINVTLPPDQNVPDVGYATNPIPISFQQNFKYVVPNPALPLTASEADEAIDVPDYRDMWLGYYPVKPAQPATNTGTAPQAPLTIDGSQVLPGIMAPSGVRPALLHYLVNYFGPVLRHDPSAPTGWSLDNPNVWNPQQRIAMLRILQRATLRPIPVINDPAGFSLSGTEYANFTGSNPQAGSALTQPIDVSLLAVNGAVGNTEAQKLIEIFKQLILGSYDVDNDADGEPDSVWVDAGLGYLTMPDGTLVKPMMAVRIEDLDSRVDVNVADSAASVQNSASGYQNLGRSYAMQPIFNPTSVTSNLLGGFGVGPAEIMLQGTNVAGNNIRGMFRNPRAANLIMGRYGLDREPGLPLSTIPATPNPSIINVGDDVLSVWGAFGRPAFHNVSRIRLFDGSGQDLGEGPFPASSFGFPMDLFGRSMIALDPFGQPYISSNMTSIIPLGTGDDLRSDPYEVRYKSSGGIDTAYTPGELEPVVRYRDWDRNALAGRLREVVDSELEVDEYNGTTQQDNFISRDTLPRAITTVSASLNKAPMVPPSEYTAPSANVDGTVHDQLINYSPMTRLAMNLLIDTSAAETLSETQYEVLFPPELRQGSRLNVNRPLGNGTNADSAGANVANRVPPLGNLTADDSAELMALTDTIFNIPTGNQYQTIGDFTPQIGTLPYAAPNSGNTLDPERLATSSNWPASAVAQKFLNQHSRAELARHLYVLAMLVTSKREGNSLANIRQYDYRVDTSNAAAVAKTKARARKLAQWAVNVVDFRDRDAIMTRFQYDWNPYDGWDEDPNQVAELDPNGDVFPVVWGCENPELLLTESINMHNRNIKDTSLDTSAQDREGGDEDPDQIKIPQGSTFIELYCIRGPKAGGNSSDLHATAPPELYSMVRRSFLDNENSNDIANDTDVIPVLDLGRLAPDGNPVWRIGVAAHQLGQSPPQSPLEVMANMNAASWDRLTFQPERGLDINNNANVNFRFDRVIWFANQDPANVGTAIPTDSRGTTNYGAALLRDDEAHIFFNQFGPATYFDGTAQGPGGLNNRIVAGLQGGQYAVVGPRRMTFVGSQDYNADLGPVDLQSYRTNQYFQLNAQKDTNYNYRFRTVVPSVDGNNQLISLPLTPQDNTIRDIVPILAAAKAPQNWTATNNTAPTGIGVNISEPLPTNSYYREPKFRLNEANGQPADIYGINGYAYDSYINYEDPADPANINIPDEPFDYDPAYPLGGIVETGTRENFRTMYLQRLADPTVPYDPVLNPYMTVDWMPMDLTVFNGEERQDREITDPMTMMNAPVETRDPTPFGNNVRFGSRAKTGIGIEPDGSNRFVSSDHVIWSYGTNQPAQAQQQTIPMYDPNFPYLLAHRNDVNGSFAAAAPYNNAQPASGFTLGFLNESFGQRYVPANLNASTVMWVGSTASNPFPWLGFLNRDFASPFELMLVPATSPDRLMLEFSIPSTAAAFNPYIAKNSAGDPDLPSTRDYGHLMNYFSVSADPELAPNFHRVLDFLETQDMFIESKHMYDAVRLKNPETARELDAMSIYFPPFNIVQKHPRAGRINLNTVSNPLVWRALMHLHGDLNDRTANTMNGGGSDNDTMFWREWMLSRRGYQTGIGPNQDAIVSPLDINVPTQFRGALQLADSAWIAPNTNKPSQGANPLPMRQEGVSATLLRRVQDPQNTAQFKTLFSRPNVNNDDVGARRNAFFRYQTPMRMPNLVTDNSNTFAVWVTIGYFEVNPTNFQVGKEFGVEQGENTRPRAFYIIDRTIPVDFVPGQDTNVRDTILLERILR